MEKTDQQIAKERDAVTAMANAKANMTSTLDRIGTLERQLASAKGTISLLKGFISPSVYQYGDPKKSCHEVADEAIANIAKVLG